MASMLGRTTAMANCSRRRSDSSIVTSWRLRVTIIAASACCS
jgi:hypothetical protein